MALVKEFELITKQEEIREGIRTVLWHFGQEFLHTRPDDGAYADQLLSYLHSQGVVRKVDRELPYKWEEITRKHSYRPHKEFTSYILSNKYGKMFGYVQQYQSLTGYKCFEDQKYFVIYLGNEERAHSDGTAPTLEEAKAVLLEKFLCSNDNPDSEIPAGYVAVEPLIEETK